MTNNNIKNRYHEKDLDELIIFPNDYSKLGVGTYNRLVLGGYAKTQIAHTDIDIYTALAENKFKKVIAYLPLFNESVGYMPMVKNAISAIHNNGGEVELYSCGDATERIQKLDDEFNENLLFCLNIHNRTDEQISALVGDGHHCHPLLDGKSYKLPEDEKNNVFKNNAKEYLSQFDEPLFKKYLENNPCVETDSKIEKDGFLMPITGQVEFLERSGCNPIKVNDKVVAWHISTEFDRRGDFTYAHVHKKGLFK